MTTQPVILRTSQPNYAPVNTLNESFKTGHYMSLACRRTRIAVALSLVLKNRRALSKSEAFNSNSALLDFKGGVGDPTFAQKLAKTYDE